MSGKLRSRAKVIFAVTIVSLGFGLLAQAQTFTGAVSGRVVDSQQAAIANASVTLRSVEKGFERRTATNPQGEYAFELVPPGKFTLRAEASGFAATTVNAEVVVATPVRADLILGVQSLKQEVKVLGENGVSVQTESASLGQIISSRQISELPSLTRNPYDFLAIMPGANLSNDGRGVGLAPYGSNGGGKSGGIALNGQRTVSGNFLLDGGENNDTFVAAPAQSVPLDSIAEVNVQTNHYTAEYGRNAGFTANVITRSGTQQFHGSLYDYTRNSALAANTFDNNANGFPRPVFNRHQFGGTLGGPIRKKNLFFFVSIEPILVRSSGSNPFHVPTPQLLAISSPGTQAIFQRYPLPGNLSSTDVLTLTVCPFAVTCDSQKQTGFVTIPAFAFTSRTGPQDAGAGPPQNTVLATGRVDWMIDAKTQFFVRYAFQDNKQFPIVLQPYSSQLDQPNLTRNQNIALNLTRSWSANLTTESRTVYNRVLFSNPLVPQPSIPAFVINNEGGSTLPFGSIVLGGPQNLYQFFQTATWVHGHQTLKFGGQYVQLRDNRTGGFAGIADAQFKDVQGFVNGILAVYIIAIDPKGHFPGETVDPPFGPPSFTRHYRYNEPALFIEDTWRITARLTLTPGLRWEYFDVLHSPGAEHPLDSNFYLGGGSNYFQQIANGRFLRTVDAHGGLQGHFYLPDFRNFAPRLGLAYDLTGDGKTVFRGGVGVFYDRMVGFQLFNVFVNPPSYSVTRLTNVPVTPALLSNQYAAFSNQLLLMNQSSTKAPAQNFRPAYTVSWNATFERELAGNLVMGISYVGASDTRLYSADNINRIGSGGLLDPSCITTRLASDGITPLGPLYISCPRLNRNVTSIVIRGNEGHSTFHALQLKLDSRYLWRWGLQFGVNYTLSHSIDNASSSIGGDPVAQGARFLAAFQPSLDRGSSDFDQRHRIAANFIWDIPLGRNSDNWRGRYLLGGWEISGLLSYQTGQPFSILDSGAPDYSDEAGRPRLVGKQPSPVALIPDAVSPNAFLYVPINQVYDPATTICMATGKPFACEISVNGPFNGVISRNTYRRPGTYYQDTSLLKNIPLPREGMKLQFRVELFNLFNHPNLYVNSGTNDVNTANFNPSAGLTVPGVTASFADSRQIVLALKFIF
jgi:Carboxypeptidase regulatory-like domain/TonB dependent receptor/TonB-dependent Receptor Plug Domain